MSFYRITDPKKRDAMVADYIETVKRIKRRNLDERLGSLAHQQQLDETLNPIIEASEKSSTAITNELKPIKKEIEDLNIHLREGLPQQSGRKRKREDAVVGLTALLEGDYSRQDMYFGIQRKPDDSFVLGNKKVEIDENNDIHIDKRVYKGTPGLLSLVMDISPKKFTQEDYDAYKEIALQTDLANNPQGVQANSKPKKTNKYKNYLVKIAEEQHREKNDNDEEDDEDDDINEKAGTGIISFLPSTINELFEKLKLLAAEFLAGNTTTRNELVAVLDQLRTRKLITEKQYTTINTLLSRHQE